MHFLNEQGRESLRKRLREISEFAACDGAWNTAHLRNLLKEFAHGSERSLSELRNELASLNKQYGLATRFGLSADEAVVFAVTRLAQGVVWISEGRTQAGYEAFGVAEGALISANNYKELGLYGLRELERC